MIKNTQRWNITRNVYHIYTHNRCIYIYTYNCMYIDIYTQSYLCVLIYFACTGTVFDVAYHPLPPPPPLFFVAIWVTLMHATVHASVGSIRSSVEGLSRKHIHPVSLRQTNMAVAVKKKVPMEKTHLHLVRGDEALFHRIPSFSFWCGLLEFLTLHWLQLSCNLVANNY